MKKIMFNDKFGLTKAVLEGKKSQTRRIALHSKEDVQVLDELNLAPEDRSIRQYVIDKYSRFKDGETVAVAQSYKSLYEIMSTFTEEKLIEEPNITIKGLRDIPNSARSAEMQDILEAQGKLELKRDYGKVSPSPLDIILRDEKHRIDFQNLIKTARGNKVSEVIKNQDLTTIEPDKGPRNEIVEIETRKNVLIEQAKYFINYYQEALRLSPGWENKLFIRPDLMPHRIHITDIRLERLQDISDEDCIREGIIEDFPGVQYSFPTEIGYCGQYPFGTPKAAYAALIDKVSGKGTWEKNPWVFVYDFELAK